MISIVPSLWEEPAGLTVLEALAAKSALITTNKGGISEVAKGKSIIIDVFETDKNYNRFVNDLSFSIKTLLTDDEKFRNRILQIMDEEVIMRFESKQGKAEDFYDIDQE